MKKLKEAIKMAKYITALENEGFDSIEDYRNELFNQVYYILTNE